MDIKVDKGSIVNSVSGNLANVIFTSMLSLINIDKWN